MTARRSNRRDFLRAATLGGAAAATSLSSSLRALTQRAAHLLPPKSGAEKLLVIDLAGAADMIHAFYPIGDSSLDPASAGPHVRSSLLQPAASLLPLAGSLDSYVGAHLNWAPLVFGPGNADAARDLAVLYQVGNPEGSRSHFTEMQRLASAHVPNGFAQNPEGYVPRLADVANFPPNLPAAAVSQRAQRAFRTPIAGRPQLAHVKSIVDYRLEAVDDLGLTITQPIDPAMAQCLRDGIDTHLNSTPAGTAGGLVAAAHDFFLRSEPIVQMVDPVAAHAPLEFPIDAAEAGNIPDITTPMGTWSLTPYGPGHNFARECEEALLLLEQTPCRVAGVQLGGWDTHTGQAARRNSLDPWLAFVLNSLYQRLRGTNTTILVYSEFGRRNSENPGQGTDHGNGTAFLVLGSAVKGKVFNCHGGTGHGIPWNELGNTRPQWDDAIEVQVDQIMVLGEILQRRFGLRHAEINTVIPEWNALRGTAPDPLYPLQYQTIDFIKPRKYQEV